MLLQFAATAAAVAVAGAAPCCMLASGNSRALLSASTLRPINENHERLDGLSGAYAAFGARSNFDCMQAQLESGEFAVIDKLIYYSHD